MGIEDMHMHMHRWRRRSGGEGVRLLHRVKSRGLLSLLSQKRVAGRTPAPPASGPSSRATAASSRWTCPWTCAYPWTSRRGAPTRRVRLLLTTPSCQRTRHSARGVTGLCAAPVTSPRGATARFPRCAARRPALRPARAPVGDLPALWGRAAVDDDDKGRGLGVMS